MQPLYIGLAVASALGGFVGFLAIGYRSHWRMKSRVSAAGTALVFAGGLALAVWFAGRALAPDDLGLLIFSFTAALVGLVQFSLAYVFLTGPLRRESREA